MFPIVIVGLLLGGIAYAASAKSDASVRDPRTLLPTGELDDPITDDELDEIDDVVMDDPYIEDPIVEPDPLAPGEIPYGPRLLFELWLTEDGQMVDEYGDEYDDMVDIDVCAGDTVVLHVPPGQDFQGAREQLDSGGADIPIPVVSDSTVGLMVWHIEDYGQEPGEPDAGKWFVGVELWDSWNETTVGWGFHAYVGVSDCLPV